MKNTNLSNFDEYYVSWWAENKKHFKSQIENKELCDEAVKHIAVMDFMLKGGKWEMNQSTTAFFHSYFKSK
jgi:hypothetical protein